MSGLTLRLREIDTALPTTEAGTSIAPTTPAGTDTWHDSTLDLERGLEVLELPVEIADAAPGPVKAR